MPQKKSHKQYEFSKCAVENVECFIGKFALSIIEPYEWQTLTCLVMFRWCVILSLGFTLWWQTLINSSRSTLLQNHDGWKTKQSVGHQNTFYRFSDSFSENLIWLSELTFIHETAQKSIPFFNIYFSQMISIDVMTNLFLYIQGWEQLYVFNDIKHMKLF